MNGTWFPWSGAYYGRMRNGFRNTTTGKARKHFGERTDTLWIASARAARQTSNGCFTPTIIHIRYETWNGRSGILSRIRLRRLARAQRLWAAIQGRAQSGYSFIGRLAVPGNEPARSEQAHHDCGMGDRRISDLPRPHPAQSANRRGSNKVWSCFAPVIRGSKQRFIGTSVGKTPTALTAISG